MFYLALGFDLGSRILVGLRFRDFADLVSTKCRRVVEVAKEDKGLGSRGWGSVGRGLGTWYWVWCLMALVQWRGIGWLVYGQKAKDKI